MEWGKLVSLGVVQELSLKPELRKNETLHVHPKLPSKGICNHFSADLGIP